MKKLILLIFLVIGVFGCREDVVEFTLEQSTANVYVNSNPRNADIYLNNNFTGRLTPDTLKHLEPGSYVVTFKLTGYKDSSVTFSVEAAERQSVFVSLRSK